MCIFTNRHKGHCIKLKFYGLNALYRRGVELHGVIKQLHVLLFGVWWKKIYKKIIKYRISFRFLWSLLIDWLDNYGLLERCFFRVLQRNVIWTNKGFESLCQFCLANVTWYLTNDYIFVLLGVIPTSYGYFINGTCSTKKPKQNKIIIVFTMLRYVMQYVWLWKYYYNNKYKAEL